MHESELCARFALRCGKVHLLRYSAKMGKAGVELQKILEALGKSEVPTADEIVKAMDLVMQARGLEFLNDQALDCLAAIEEPFVLLSLDDENTPVVDLPTT